MFDIQELIILLNNYCNLCCSYCDFRKNKSEEFIECSRQHLEKAITLFFECIKFNPEVKRVLCFNADGETLLSKELLINGIKFAAKLKKNHGKNVVLAIVTNGILIDYDLAFLFFRFKISVTISIDGDSFTHDKHRVDKNHFPTHAKVINGIYHLKKLKVPFSVRSVITSETVPHITETYNFLKKLHPSRLVKLRPVRKKQYPLLSEKWIQTFTKNYTKCIKTLLLNGVDISEFPDDAYYFAKFITKGISRQRYCSAGYNMLWMTPSGFFTSCGLFSNTDKILGHIDMLACAEDLCNLLEKPFASVFRNNSPQFNEPCISCFWVDVCNGGCPALKILSGKTKESPLLCQYYSTLGSMLKSFYNAINFKR